MNRVIAISLVLFSTTVCVNAQTYLQHLQNQSVGTGKVVVKQSKDIDDLVNGSHKTIAVTEKKDEKKTSTPAEKPATTTTTLTHKTQTATVEQPEKDVETETAPVDMRKKVMRRSYKVNGYRVQIFAGGNSRSDKIKAQRAGNNVKQAFPDQPIYVHFYSPRWICRMGNYRTYEEANAMLRQIKKLGFKEACIVSGKIVVPY